MMRQDTTTTCDRFQDETIRADFAATFDEFVANPSLGPGKIIPAANHYKPVRSASDDVDPVVQSALSSFNRGAENAKGASLDVTTPQVSALAKRYVAVNEACAGFFTPRPVAFEFTCHDEEGATTATAATYQEAWGAQSTHCDAHRIGGNTFSEQETTAVAAAYGAGHSMESLKFLYGQCAQVNGYIVNPSPADGSGRLSIGQSTEASGALLLCPDHPQAAAIQANIDAVGVAAAADSAHAQEAADGTYAQPGKYLIGTDLQPGTWQSIGPKVTDCYWAISDGQGDIIDGDFISIAPQFTIQIPADAARFTNTGCSFERIGD